MKDWTAGDFNRVFAKAARKANFSWADTDVLAAADHLKVPVFLIHGAKDRWISPEHSKRLNEQIKATHRLLLLPEDDHLLLSMRLLPIATEVEAWFEEYLR